jgi:Ricin-type beta-trefoil lectin domain-like/TIR domain
MMGSMSLFCCFKEEMMEVFLSWSGTLSKKVAKGLYDWLPDVLQVVQPWMSTSDIAKGKDFTHALWQQLAKSNFGVLCLTKENCRSPWILFEAGALGKVLEASYICPYLIDMEPEDLPFPLRSLQTVPMDEEGTFDLVRTINSASQSVKLSENHLKKSFDRWWPELKPKLESKVKSMPPRLQAGEFFLMNVKSGRFLQAVTGELINGAHVEVVDYTGDDPQLWSFHVEKGRFVIRSGYTGLCLDVEGGVKATGEGVRIHQWEYHGSDNQKWAVIPQKDGSCRLKCKHSARYLAYNGDHVAQMGEFDTRSQRWWLLPVLVKT